VNDRSVPRFSCRSRIAAIAGGCNPPAPCGLPRFESLLLHQFMYPSSSVAEYSSDKGEVVGSIPTLGTKICKFQWAWSRPGIRLACTEKDGVQFPTGPPI
jgi:hypothetical protein